MGGRVSVLSEYLTSMPSVTDLGLTGVGSVGAGSTVAPAVRGITGSQERPSAEQEDQGPGLLFRHTLSREEALEVLKLGESLDDVPAHGMPSMIKGSIRRAVERLVGGVTDSLKEGDEVACCFKNLFTLHSMLGVSSVTNNDLTTVLVGRLYGELLTVRQVPRVWVRLLHTLIEEPWPFLHYSSFSDVARSGARGTSWESLLASLAVELGNCKSNKYSRTPSGTTARDIPQYLYAKPVSGLCTRMVKLLAVESNDVGPEVLPQYSIVGMLLRMAAGTAANSPSRPSDSSWVREYDLKEYKSKAALSSKQNVSLAGGRCRSMLLQANEIEKRWFLMASYSPRMSSEISAALAFESDAQRVKKESEVAEKEKALAALLGDESRKEKLDREKASILSGPLRKLLRDLCAGRPVKGVQWGSTDKGEKHDAVFGAFLRRSPQDLRQLLGGQMEGRTVRVLLKYPSLYPLLLMAAPSRDAHTLSEESLQDLRQAYLNRSSTRQLVAQAAPGIAAIREAIDPFKQELPVGTGVTLHDIKYRQGIERDPLGVWVLAGCPGLQAFDTGINFGTLGCASERAEDLLLFVSVLKNLKNRGIVSYSERADVAFDTGGINPYSWDPLLTALETVSSRIGDSRNGICFVSDAYRDLSYSDLSVMSSKQLSTMHKGSTVLPLTHFVQKVLSLRGTKLAFESAEYLIPLLQLLGEVVRTGGSCVDPRPTVFRSVALERLGLPARVVSMMMRGEGQTYESEPQGMRAWLQVEEALPKIVGEARPVASFMME